MILGILQARFTSTRLPGKVLKPILGKPMLQRQMERLQRATRLSKLTLATSQDPSDEKIAALCGDLDVPCFRGDLEDVLDRFYHAALPWRPEHVVRLTGDCPLTDPELLDKIVDLHLREGNDYTSNTIKPTYPDGLDVEVCRFAVLEEAWKEARLKSQREHVTTFVHQQPRRYKVMNYASSEDLSSLRWTVDEPEDFALVSAVYAALYPHKPAFTTADVLDFLGRDPALMHSNETYERNEGLKRSLAQDEVMKP